MRNSRARSTKTRIETKNAPVAFPDPVYSRARSTKTGIETPVFTPFSSVERGLTDGFWGISSPGRQQKKYIEEELDLR